MAQFRGLIQGARGEASRLGHKGTGLRVEAQSWQGKIVTRLWHDDRTGQDMAEVTMDRHNGVGARQTLYVGPVNGCPDCFGGCPQGPLNNCNGCATCHPSPAGCPQTAPGALEPV